MPLDTAQSPLLVAFGLAQQNFEATTTCALSCCLSPEFELQRASLPHDQQNPKR
jgi:hypothetical protein